MPVYTVCYTKTESGYTGQLLEWPEVISEGATIEECRVMVEDAAYEMAAVYEEEGLLVPQGLKRHNVFDRFTANALCKQAGIDTIF